MSSNEHPDMSGSGCDDDYYSSDEVAEKQNEAFIAGAQQMREMLARFVEQGGSDIEKKIAVSLRANWVPGWGDERGVPLVFDCNSGITGISWIDEVAPALASLYERADGEWFPTHIWRLE